MPITNPQTARAATRAAPQLNRQLALLGVFTSQTEARALVQTLTGETVMLQTGVPQDGLTLTQTGDGWAMVRENDRVHRLVIA